MAKINKFTDSIERFMQSDRGQRFLNIAFSVGAAVVIWGALFKILDLPGGSLILCIGMGTEILMFLLMAFDAPTASSSTVHAGDGAQGECTGMSNGKRISAKQVTATLETPENPGSASAQVLETHMNEIVEQMEQLTKNIAGLNTIYEIQLRGISGQLENIYSVNQSMKDIRDMYGKSSAESVRYQEEAEKMTRQMQQLNEVYAKMLKAMTVNIPSGNGSPFAS